MKFTEADLASVPLPQGRRVYQNLRLDVSRFRTANRIIEWPEWIAEVQAG